MRMRMITAALAAVAAFTTSLAGAHFDREPCNGAITILPQPGPGGNGNLYIDDRSDPDVPDDIDHWIYIEANGHNGLQTGGSNDVHGLDESPVANFYDGCFSEHGIANGQDSLVF